MIEEDYMYQCKLCKKISTPKHGIKPPVCCNKPMAKRVVFTFTTPDDPEMTRNYDEDITYDHGRGFYL